MDNTIQAFPIIKEFCPYESLPQIFNSICNQPYSFFLDSGGGIFQNARYSFFGSNPFLVFQSFGKEIVLCHADYKKEEHFRADPFSYLKKLLRTFKIISSYRNPPFLGGAVGYFGYDLARLIESIPDNTKADISIPDCCIGLYSTVIAVDHKDKRVWIISSGLPEDSRSLQYKRAQNDIAKFAALLIPDDFSDINSPCRQKGILPVLRPNFTQNTYIDAVVKAKQYIASGDIYQVNLSQRFTCDALIPPSLLYRNLQRVNPAPFSCFMNLIDHHILSSSPERFLRISGNIVETRPIKGTRPRGRTKIEDERLKRELLLSKKDRAELIMIVDLERNDLGRVCHYGSIHPTELITLETYPTVHHLVSTIRGKLVEGYDHIDCLRACFPGGSITGAPKIRSMEIIEELEPTRRKIYTGSIGYLGFNGETDLNIAIRTILLYNNKYYFQVGGGIVADSDPLLEYEETLHKGKGLLRALGGDFWHERDFIFQ